MSRYAAAALLLILAGCAGAPPELPMLETWVGYALSQDRPCSRTLQLVIDKSGSVLPGDLQAAADQLLADDALRGFDCVGNRVFSNPESARRPMGEPVRLPRLISDRACDGIKQGVLRLENERVRATCLAQIAEVNSTRIEPRLSAVSAALRDAVAEAIAAPRQRRAETCLREQLHSAWRLSSDHAVVILSDGKDACGTRGTRHLAPPRAEEHGGSRIAMVVIGSAVDGGDFVAVEERVQFWRDQLPAAAVAVLPLRMVQELPAILRGA